jgi:hypothetical protein
MTIAKANRDYLNEEKHMGKLENLKKWDYYR